MKKSDVVEYAISGGLLIAAGWLAWKAYKGFEGATGYLGQYPNGGTFSQFNSNDALARKYARHNNKVEIWRALMKKTTPPASAFGAVEKILPNGMSQSQFRSWQQYLASRDKPTTWKHYAPNTLAFPSWEVTV